MPWQQGGGGPWGGGGGGNSPWGRPSGGGPFGSGPTPPNIEDLIRRSQERMKRFLPGGRGNSVGVALVLVALVLAWLASGIFRVEPGQLGMTLLFGKAYGQATPGLNYNLPRPIGSVVVVSVEAINAPPEFMMGKILILGRKPVNKAKLADPSISMKEVAA